MSGLYKAYCKLFNRDVYLEIKKNESLARLKKRDSLFAERSRLISLPDIFCGEFNFSSNLSCKHSGHIGDVIYSLPMLKAFSEYCGVDLWLVSGAPARIERGWTHPTGTAMLNNKVIDGLLGLLTLQSYIKNCGVYTGVNVDIDLDLFRKTPLDLGRGSIARYYTPIWPIKLNLDDPWLAVNPVSGFEDFIVISRSSRYQNPVLDYSFLDRYSRKVFVGVESEFKEIKKIIPSIDFYKTESFIDLAAVIAGCRLFIGNQSSPFAIAEALKVNRILECYYDAPNVIPQGGIYAETWFQPQFEFCVSKMYAGEY